MQEKFRTVCPTEIVGSKRPSGLSDHAHAQHHGHSTSKLGMLIAYGLPCVRTLLKLHPAGVSADSGISTPLLLLLLLGDRFTEGLISGQRQRLRAPVRHHSYCTQCHHCGMLCPSVCVQEEEIHKLGADETRTTLRVVLGPPSHGL
jgi:hypothetical protein